KDAAGRIEGSVRDTAGRRPPGEIAVHVSTAFSPVVLRSAAGREDGAYTGAVPSRGPYPADASLASPLFTAPPPPAQFDSGGAARAAFVVEPAGSLRVRLPARRSPTWRVVVTARPQGGASEERSLDIDAAWIAAHGAERVLGGLAPGRYWILVAWDGEAWP